jgi:hypothetical protein
LKELREIPVTECWRESYAALASEAAFEYFPTRAYLAANPEKSQLFCRWVWRMLHEREGRVCKTEMNDCLNCQKQGLSKWTAMYVLSHIVRDEDPGLYVFLKDKCRQFQTGGRAGHPDDLPPGDAPGPKGPLAKRMPVPRPPVFTDAVARELLPEHFTSIPDDDARQVRPGAGPD